MMTIDLTVTCRESGHITSFLEAIRTHLANEYASYVLKPWGVTKTCDLQANLEGST